MEIRLMLLGVLSTILIVPNNAERCRCNTESSNSKDCGDIPYGIKGGGDVCYKTTGNRKCAKVTCLINTIIKLVCKTTGITGFWSPDSPVCEDVTTQPQTTTTSPAKSFTQSTITTAITTTSAAANTSTDATTSTAAIANTTTTTTNTTTTTTTTTASTTTTTTTTTAVATTTTISATSSSPYTTQATTGINKGISSNDENIAVFVAVPVCIVVVMTIVIVFIIVRRRKTRSKGTVVFKPRLHGAISNNSYQDPTSNGNIIPMNDLAPTTIDNGYIEIFDDKPTSIDTSDSRYNTISLPNESEHTYGHLKPVTGPFVDNTYSHMDKAQIEMGALYSHIGNGTAPEQTTQPVSINDNTYSHIGKGTANAKTKNQIVDSDDTYSHITKGAAVPIIKQKTVETDATYSHIGKGFNPHHKTADTDGDDTYNTLGIMPNVSLQNNDETNDDPEYNHLTSGLQSTSKYNDPQKKDDAFSCYRQEPSSGVTGSSTSCQYAQVGKKDTYETVDNIKGNTDNEKTSNCFFVVDEDNEESTAQSDTDGGQVNHQYFILEKHERE